MVLLVERLVRRGLELRRWLDVERGEPAEVRMVRERNPAARLPDFDDSQAPLLKPGGDWRVAVDTTVWLRFHMQRPSDWPVAVPDLVAERLGRQRLEPSMGPAEDMRRMQGMR